MDRVKSLAMSFLSGRTIGPDDAVMFDIDDTLLTLRAPQYDVVYPIKEMISLYKFAEMIGYKVVIITARPYSKENGLWTYQQLLEIGINPIRIYFAPPMEKGDVKVSLGLKFVLSVGDQWTDLTKSDKSIKLPDTVDPRILINFS
tara:strand:- start:3875 stop:4309 length:435 start_codon:yes stop_codon:yes gene_type:complete